MIFDRTFGAVRKDEISIRKCVRLLYRVSCLAAVFLVVLAAPLMGHAQTTHFTSTIWRSQDGLPENIVQALMQDREGYLWVGTTGGLTRFDGAHFKLGQ